MSRILARMALSSTALLSVRGISPWTKQPLTRTNPRQLTLSSSSAGSFSQASRLDGLDKPTVWHEFSPLAVENGAVNLGQGFPDWNPPKFCVDAMVKSVDPVHGRQANQYARPNAHLALAEVIADDYQQRWGTSYGSIDPVTQVATAVGCTNVLYCALQAMVNPGDSVILLEPAFDIYMSQVRMAGGKPVYVPLRQAEIDHSHSPMSAPSASDMFSLDLSELEASITEKTKILILNTPHNPTGKVFSRPELEGIAEIIRKHPQMVVIADEVYEHILFDQTNEPHISIATILPDQTLTLSSSGKTFSCTGWKVGWAVGPAHLVQAVVAAQQWVNFSAPTPNQDAIAQALIQARQPYEGGFDTYYAYLAEEYARKRGILVDALRVAGMKPIIPPGGFFIMADTTAIEIPREYREEKTLAMPANPMPRDWALSRWLTKVVGVTAIPPSAFYSEENIPLAKNLLRFAFCKSEETLAEAHRRLESYFQR